MTVDAALSGMSPEVDVKPTRTRYHLCQDLQGAIANWGRDMWESIGRDNDMTGDAVKERFRIWVFEGKRVIPFGDPCEGFSYIDGCPGHPIEDEPPGGDHG